MNELNYSDLRELIEPSSEDCVSIYMPCEVTGREIRQNQLRLRDLLEQAEERLVHRGLRRDASQHMLRPARRLLGETESQAWHATPGLALLFSPGWFQKIELPYPPEESITVGRRFHISPLLPMISRSGEYCLMALSAGRVRVFRGDRRGLQLAPNLRMPRTMAEAFDERQPRMPLQDEPPQGRFAGLVTERGAAYFNDDGSFEDDRRHEVEEMLRMVDAGICNYLRGSDAPLILAAVERIARTYRSINRYPHLIEPIIAGNPDHLSPQQLHALAWPVVQSELARQRERAAQKVRNASQAVVASEIDKILHAARQGRIDTLFVSADARLWGHFDPATGAVDVTANGSSADFHRSATTTAAEDAGSVAAGQNAEPAEDLLETAAVETIRHAGEVHAVASYEMPVPAPAVALLRY